MAVRMLEPKKTGFGLDDWDKLILRTQLQGAGFICMDMTHLNGSGKPDIKPGSRFEIMSCYYHVKRENEGVSGAPSEGEGQYYIYTKHDTATDTVSFYFSKGDPVWDAQRGGWYSSDSKKPTDRAIAKFFYTGGQYNGKVILDSYNAKFTVNTRQDYSLITSGGIEVFKYGVGAPAGKTGPVDMLYELPAGVYRYALKGGNGGNGGNKGNAGSRGYGQQQGGSDGNDGLGGYSNPVTAGVFLHCGGTVRVKVGKDGGDGGIGGKGADGVSGSADAIAGNGGSGGGGGAGIESVIGPAVAQGGKPGTGGEGRDGCNPGSTGGYDGVGGAGSCGSPTTGNTTYLGKSGKPGGLPKETTSGYAHLWRVG